MNHLMGRLMPETETLIVAILGIVGLELLSDIVGRVVDSIAGYLSYFQYLSCYCKTERRVRKMGG